MFCINTQRKFTTHRVCVSNSQPTNHLKDFRDKDLGEVSHLELNLHKDVVRNLLDLMPPSAEGGGSKLPSQEHPHSATINRTTTAILPTAAWKTEPTLKQKVKPSLLVSEIIDDSAQYTSCQFKKKRFKHMIHHLSLICRW